MTVQQKDRPPGYHWIRKAMPASIVLLIVGSLGTGLYRAVEQARNAARAATTI
jgi:hypothetical protein